MELLAYVFTFFGFFILIKGIKPTIKWIEKYSEKELSKGIGFITLFFTICFYLIVMIKYLISF